MQGLKNLGSTGAINSLIQIICRNKYLRNSLLNEDIPENTIAIELKEILKILYIDNNSISPNKFIYALYNSLNNYIVFGEQIDITELWFLLFDKISTEINLITYDNEYNKEYDNITIDNPLINSKAKYIISKFNNFKNSKWLENSQGIILNIIECNKCNNISYNFEPFISIQLDLPHNNDNISLTSLFRNYLKSLKNKDEWKCDKCNKCTEYTKSFKLWELPKVLVFFIKRYSNINEKNNRPVNINENINIKKGCILSDINLDLTYNLSSIGMHIGNLNNGHYYAICKNEKDNKFISYDDLDIKVFNKDNKNFLNNNKDAYMIVYSI